MIISFTSYLNGQLPILRNISKTIINNQLLQQVSERFLCKEHKWLAF